MNIHFPKELTITPRFSFFPIDDCGVIENICSLSKLQPKWVCALDDICGLCTSQYPDVQGIYIRGSVALGNAIDGTSDIDCIIVFGNREATSDGYREWADTVERHIIDKYPFVAAVELYGLSRSEVLNCPRTVFFLKSQSQCIWGQDLTKDLPAAVLGPSAYVHAPRFVSELEYLSDIFSKEPHGIDLLSLSKKFSKRMLRTGFELVMLDMQVYSRELYLCYKACTSKWPQFDGLWLELLSFSINGAQDFRRYSEILETLGKFIATLVSRRDDIPDVPDCFIDDFGEISQLADGFGAIPTFPTELGPRESLRDLQEYRLDNPFGAVTSPLAIKLDANEITSSDFDKRLEVSLPARLLEQYPDPEAKQLKGAIAKAHGVPEDMIVIGNGSDELINNIMLAFFGKRLMLVDVGYPVYEHLARIYEMQTRHIDLTSEFALPSDIFEQFTLHAPEIVFFSFPNNPTGNLFDEATVRQLVSDFPSTVFVIDEAYFEFSGVTLVDLVQTHQNVIVLRTLSKAYSLAGLRLGYAICGPSLTAVLHKVSLPYNVSSVSQHLGLRFFDERKPFVRHVAAQVTKLRREVVSRLERHPALVVFPSTANFLFVKLRTDIDADELAKRLADNSVFLRFMSFGERGRFIRFSLGMGNKSEAAVVKLLAELDKLKTHTECGVR